MSERAWSGRTCEPSNVTSCMKNVHLRDRPEVPHPASLYTACHGRATSGARARARGGRRSTAQGGARRERRGARGARGSGSSCAASGRGRRSGPCRPFCGSAPRRARRSWRRRAGSARARRPCRRRTRRGGGRSRGPVRARGRARGRWSRGQDGWVWVVNRGTHVGGGEVAGEERHDHALIRLADVAEGRGAKRAQEPVLPRRSCTRSVQRAPDPTAGNGTARKAPRPR